MIKTNWIEENNTHTLYVTEGEETVASGCLRVTKQGFFMENLLVPENRRGEGFGDFAARLLIRRCCDLGGVTQRIADPGTAAGFFQKLGFVAFGAHGEMVRHGDIFGNCGN